MRAAHDRAGGLHVDLEPGNEIGGAAALADPGRDRHLDAEELEQEPADRVSVESHVARLHQPVAPNRSVLIDSGSYPSSTSPSAAASTKRVDPQMKTCGRSVAGHATSRRRSTPIRRE